MMKKVKRICPVCSNGEYAKVLKNISMEIPDRLKLPDSYDIVCCEKCGFCYADTQASNEDYDYYYKNCNTYSHMPKETIEAQSKFNLVEEIMKNLFDEESKLINIGIGDGLFEIQAFNHSYKNIMGIDPSITSVEKLQEKGIKAFVGSVYDEHYDNVHEKADGIFLFDVLEHLLEPKVALKQITKFIKEKGKLFVTMPNFGEINKNTTQVVNNFNQEHINYFSDKSLKNLLIQFGFEEIINESSPYIFFAVYRYKADSNLNLIEKDIITEYAIEKYFQMEDKNIQGRSEKIEILQKSNEPIVIWGTGAFTMNLMATTKLRECNILAYIDNNPLKIGKDFYNKKIVASNDLKFQDKSTILISSMLYADDIEKQIRKMGLKNKIIKIK